MNIIPHQEKEAQIIAMRENAQRQLAEIKTLDEGVNYLSKIKALEAYARATKQDAEIVLMVQEQKLRSMRILGGLLEETELNGGSKGVGINQHNKVVRSHRMTAPPDNRPRLSDLGITKNESSTYQKIASIPQDIFEQQIETVKTNADTLRELTVSKFKHIAKDVELKKSKQVAAQQKQDEPTNLPIIKNQHCTAFLNEFDDESIDLLITDPPYYTEFGDAAKFRKFLGQWLHLAIKKVKKTGRIFICTGAYAEEIYHYSDFLVGGKRLDEFSGDKIDGWVVDAPLVWTYRNTLGVTPKMKYNLNYQLIWHLYTEQSIPLDNSITSEMFSVQDISAPDGRVGNRYHTWQKPDLLADRLIRHASRPGDLAVDCFACTGTFLLSAASLGRRAVGCDIDEQNIAIAVKRGCSYE